MLTKLPMIRKPSSTKRRKPGSRRWTRKPLASARADQGRFEKWREGGRLRQKIRPAMIPMTPSASVAQRQEPRSARSPAARRAAMVPAADVKAHGEADRGRRDFFGHIGHGDGGQAGDRKSGGGAHGEERGP